MRQPILLSRPHRGTSGVIYAVHGPMFKDARAGLQATTNGTKHPGRLRAGCATGLPASKLNMRKAK